MRSASSSPYQPFAVPLALIAAAVIFITSCGSGGSMPSSPPLAGNTSVTVMLTSTGNDQLSEFDIGFLGITLSSQSGKTVTLLPTFAPGSGPGAEFVELNGTAQPLFTASIPQDVYTSATVSLNSSQFVCIELGPDDGEQVLDTSTYDFPGVSDVTVNLPSPITVTGTSMGVSLDLLMAQSASYSACFTPEGVSTSSLTPTFNLTPLTLSSSPTNAANGKVTGLDGQVTAIGATSKSFSLTVPDAEGARTVSVSPGSNTVYQGISNVSAVEVGTFVDMDGAIQSDGSMLATRIAVEDPSAGDIFSGPMILVTPSVSTLYMLPRQQQGQDFLCCYQGGSIPVNYSTAVFQISGQFTNLASLPFVPSFAASNMVPGQNVYFSVATYAAFTGGPFPTATTMTLMPQTINATVVGSTTSGAFTDYTVSLASYDLFPMLAVQPNQTTVENNPSQVEVYVDNNTQMLNMQPLAAGSTLRFYGLVFNDNGTLRMDCGQVNDGVSFTAQPSASQLARMENGSVQQTRREGSNLLQQTITVTTPKP